MLKRHNSPIPLIKHFAGIILCVKLPHGQSPSDPGRGFSENKKRRRARSEIPAALRLLLDVYKRQAFGGDLIQDVPDPQHHMATKETGDAIHTCLLYTSRCV